jgi:hypothetical protein
VATADVVLAPVGDRAPDPSPVLTALANTGYRLEVEGEPPLPATDNLPSAGALNALRDLWEEVAR